MLPEVNGIMNNRKNAALGYVSPSDLLDAFEEDDTETVEKATDTMRKRAGQRRGPGGTVDTALRPNTKVRLANLAYMKSKGMRGNTLKSIPRWSERVYTIKRRRGGGASPYEYQLEGKPKKEWFARELLQPVKAAGLAAARAPGRRSCGPKKLRMVESQKLEEKAEKTKKADAGAAVARACGVDNK